MRWIAIFLCSLLTATLSAEPQRYNIILINCDDLGYGDLGCYGATDIKTPNIDRLALQGMRFTDFHSGSSVCSPSRASLLTGRYPQRTGVYFVIDPRTESNERGILPEIPTIAEALKEQGYATICIGKWHVGHQPQYLPTSRGFDHFEGIPLSNDMPAPIDLEFAPNADLHGMNREEVLSSEPGLVPWMRDGEVIEFPVDQKQLTSRCTRLSLHFIEKYKAQPFFLYLAHPMPHLPLAVSDKFQGASDRGMYGDAVQEIDWSVGKIMNRLEELELADNTLLIFTSDNGPRILHDEPSGSAGPYRDGKASPYEGGHRVPAIMRLPELIPANSTCPELTTMMDIFPTLSHFAGYQVPQGLDGHDKYPLLIQKADSKTPYKSLYLEGTVRRGSWKLVLHPNGSQELFNLAQDPGETTNLAFEKQKLAQQLIKEIPEDLIRPTRLPYHAETKWQNNN